MPTFPKIFREVGIVPISICYLDDRHSDWQSHWTRKAHLKSVLFRSYR
jgi:hypothetical protein